MMTKLPLNNLSLGNKRRAFSKMVALLIQYADLLGYETAIDYVKRCEDCPVGHKNSLHKQGLAIDLHLYKDGIYLTSTQDHTPLGRFWESMGGTLGGNFDDGNHYSITHGNMK